MRNPIAFRSIRLAALLGMVGSALLSGSPPTSASEGSPGSPYPNMPIIAPPGVQIGRYLPVPETARGSAIDATKGYRTQDLGHGLYLVTDNMYQSMFLVYDTGVVVIDAPPSYASHIPAAMAEVTTNPVTHLIYSHSHIDHIGGADIFSGKPIIIIAQELTKTILQADHDPHRPIPTVVFSERYDLTVGRQKLELSYHGYGHSPGNIYIYAPMQQVLMVVDVVAPGWAPYRGLSLSQDIPGLFRQVDEILKMPFQTFVGGHVARTGTRADVVMQAKFMHDLSNSSAQALKATQFGTVLDDRDRANPWALADNYMDRATIQCVNAMTPKWSTRLAAFDAFVWDDCFAMEESLRAD